LNWGGSYGKNAQVFESREARLSSALTQRQDPVRDKTLSRNVPLGYFPSGVSGDPNDTIIQSAGLLPCVSYVCTSDLLLTNISPNAFDLLGIRAEHLIGNRKLWEQRIAPEDRGRLRTQLEQLGDEMASALHKIVDDLGSSLQVAHSFRKAKSGCDSVVIGRLVPLGSGLSMAALDSSIISQFVHKIGNHFQLANLLIGSLKRTGTNLAEIETLQQTIDRAVEFTRSFSTYSQPPACLIVVDLTDVVQSVIAVMTPLCHEKNVRLQHEIDETPGEMRILGDPFLLEIAFTSVLKNALEATKDGGDITIKSGLDTAMAGRSFARISVVDSGVGIDADMLVKATEPFVTSKRDRDGLGLSTAVRVAEFHGGTLKLSSALHQGTQVDILLPIAVFSTDEQR
jgi:signal transduction histidine kinase